MDKETNVLKAFNTLVSLSIQISLAAFFDKGKKILEIKIFICDGGVTAINSLSEPKIQLEYISYFKRE